jgi:tRNA nucleotidyltransferase (CCA-adding enzyme)
MQLETIFEKVLEKVEPTESEKKTISKNIDNIKAKVEKSISKLKLPVKMAIVAGSVPRGTFLRNKKDFDFFILFDLKVENKNLEGYVEKIVKDAFPKLKYWKEYGEHPYLKSEINGFDIEFVPGYYITKISQRKSSVDRTPLHVKFLEKRFKKKQIKEVILLKQFLSNNLFYGADLRYNGLPGYLVELLIIEYHTFLDAIKNISKWKANNFVDVEGHYKSSRIKPKFFGEPLVIIDPTDKNRNVAAAFTKENYEKLKFVSKEFLKKPSLDFFFGNIYQNKVKFQFSKINSFSFDFDPKKFKTEDAIWGCAKASLKKTISTLKNKSLKVISSSIALTGKKKGVIFIDFDKNNLMLEGPFKTDKENTKVFLEKHKAEKPKLRIVDRKQKYYVEKKFNLEEVLDNFANVFFETKLDPNNIEILNSKETYTNLKTELKKVLEKDFLKV